MEAAKTKRNVTYRMKEDLIERVKIAAARERRWPAHVVESAVERYLAEHDRARRPRRDVAPA